MEVIMNKTQKIIMFATTVLLASNYDLFAMKRVAPDNEDVQADGAKRRRHTGAAAAAPAAPASTETKAPTVHAPRSPAAPSAATSVLVQKPEPKACVENKEIEKLNARLANYIIKGGYFKLNANHDEYNNRLGPDYVEREIIALFVTATETKKIGYMLYSISKKHGAEKIYLASLSVDAEYRKDYGIGRLLILTALQDAHNISTLCNFAFADTLTRETLTPEGHPVSWYLFTHKFYFQFTDKNYVFTKELSNILAYSENILREVFLKLDKNADADAVPSYSGTK